MNKKKSKKKSYPSSNSDRAAMRIKRNNPPELPPQRPINPKPQQSVDRKPAKKKQFGQHFLRDRSIVDHMIDEVTITPETSVVEIGCGDGFLTREILTQTNCKQLWIYEIDPEWAGYVEKNIHDERLTVNLKNILDVDLTEEMGIHKPLVMLANLPYQITFPILFLVQKHKHLFQEGVVMVQEEVAQKIVATRGKKFSVTTMFLQYHFDWKLVDKVPPESFSPPPKVFSRTIYFKPKFDLKPIPNEEGFWKFLKLCFQRPRQTLNNNLKSTHYDKNSLSEKTLKLRAQQLSFDDFLELWKQIT